MIRIKEFVVPAELKRAWNEAVAPLADAALARFRTWPLYEAVGEPWQDAPHRFVRCASPGRVVRGLESNDTRRLEESANPALIALSSQERKQYLIRHAWKRVERYVYRKTETALVAATERLKWKPPENGKGYWLYSPNLRLWQHAWEQLHPRAIEAPFYEHFLTIFAAGHIPAGLQGDNWRTCRFLYF